eukprot:g23357.t1
MIQSIKIDANPNLFGSEHAVPDFVWKRVGDVCGEKKKQANPRNKQQKSATFCGAGLYVKRKIRIHVTSETSCTLGSQNCVVGSP